MRVGVVAAIDPRNPQLGSGVISSVFLAMADVVSEVVPISGQLPPLLGRAAHLSSVAARTRPRDVLQPRAAAKRVHRAAQQGRPTIMARNRLLRSRISAAGTLDGDHPARLRDACCRGVCEW